MKHPLNRPYLMLVSVAVAMVAAVLYGILNDQVTVTLSPEYFSVFKRLQFMLYLQQAGLQDAPTRIQAVLVGVRATWWFGLFLGTILGLNNVVGRRPPVTVRQYVQAVTGIMLFTLSISVLLGSIGYITEPSIKPDALNWPFLSGIHGVRAAFAVGFWHDGAYLGGFLGTLLAALWVQRQRTVASKR
jgi:hypothetical protein